MPCRMTLQVQETWGVKAFTAGITPLPTTAHHFRSWEVDELGKRMRRVMAHVIQQWSVSGSFCCRGQRQSSFHCFVLGSNSAILSSQGSSQLEFHGIYSAVCVSANCRFHYGYHLHFIYCSHHVCCIWSGFFIGTRKRYF